MRVSAGAIDRERLTLMCKVKKKDSSFCNRQQNKEKTSLACVSTSLLPGLKKGACYFARPHGWNPLGIVSRGLGSVVLSAAAWRCDSEAG